MVVVSVFFPIDNDDSVFRVLIVTLLIIMRSSFASRLLPGLLRGLCNSLAIVLVHMHLSVFLKLFFHQFV